MTGGVGTDGELEKKAGAGHPMGEIKSGKKK
jgi:hypothetical protein